MLGPYIKSSKIIELIEESTSEDGTAFKAVLRVVGSSTDWARLMVDLLRIPDEDSEFIVSVRKEYFISDEDKPAYIWVLLFWGDLLEAASEVGPVLQSSMPTPIVQPRKDPTLGIKRIQTKDGDRTRVPLPFKRGRRDDPGTTKTLSSRRGAVGAYVTDVTPEGGL